VCQHREPVAAPEIQPLDDALIGQLTADARASSSDLAARLGTSASTVRRRLHDAQDFWLALDRYPARLRTGTEVRAGPGCVRG